MRPRGGDRLGRLPWLLPAGHVLHVAEEYWGGFPAWLNEVAGADLTRERFLELNGLFLAGLVAVVVAARLARPARPLLVVVAALVVLNAALHVGGTVITGRYSPGAFTAVLVWVPLGWALLVRLGRELPRVVFGAGVALGVALHGLISAAALR